MNAGFNLWALLTGCARALSLRRYAGNEDWPAFFDLSRRGFNQSFVALIASVGAYYICAIAVQTRLAAIIEASASASGDAAASTIPLIPFVLVAGLYALSFVLSAYVLSMVFDKQDRFRAWVIVRHWSIAFCAVFVAFLFTLHLYFGFPFAVANAVAFSVYLGLLAIDIRLAQKIAGFDWGGAVLCGCLIHALGLSVLLTGLSYAPTRYRPSGGATGPQAVRARAFKAASRSRRVH